MIQWHVVSSVFRRNFVSYFINPIGYLFITAFVFGSGYFAFVHNDAFFSANLADLEQLNRYFPYLILFFVPAITMSVWAEERKTGTEELLLTLPGSDLEIVLGKYLAALAIYTVSLLFALSHVGVLMWLGNPDVGLLISNYLGYWLVGAAMLATGMVASLLTSNVTVAFILGVTVCVPLVLYPLLGGGSTGGFIAEILHDASVQTHFSPLGKGNITLSSLVYFVALIVVMLYLNVFLLGRRHWSGSEEAPEKWANHMTRAFAVALAAICLTILVKRAQATIGTSVDATAENVHTLSPDTRRILSELDSDRPVFIQAFISPEVPQDYVESKRTLIDVLNELDVKGGNAVVVRIRETEQFSEDAREAEENFEIMAQPVRTVEGQQRGEEIFLGVAVTCGLNEATIPFFDRGLSPEYELVRLIRSVAEKNRRKVGILTTDANLFGQFDFQRMRPGQDWMIIDELRKQYEVAQVSPDATITDDLDVLVVPMASSLTQTQLNNVIDFVRAGNPTLIIDDPLTAWHPDPGLPAQAPKRPANNPMMMGRQPPPTPKGNLRDLTKVLNLEFDSGNVIWQKWNPHPDLPLAEEFVFVGSGSSENALNQDNVITSNLQEMVLIYPGSVRSGAQGEGPEFTPLLRTNRLSGTTAWDDCMTETLFGRMPNRFAVRRPGPDPFTLAAMVQGPVKAAPDPTKAEKDAKAETKEIKAIFVCDLDMITDTFFDLRRRGIENLQFDNVTFILNCIDVLAGDESFIELRKKRPARRTLVRIRMQTEEEQIRSNKRREEAEAQAKEALADEQKKLDDAVKAIEERTDLDRRAKAQLMEAERNRAQQRFDKQKAEIDQEKERQIYEAQADLQRAIRTEQRRVKILAMLFPPIPALLLGIAVFVGRIQGEREGVNPDRLV